MAGINVNLIDATTDTTYTVELPRDIPMSRLIPALLTRLALPITDFDGQAVCYWIRTETGDVLEEYDTLISKNVQDGGSLILYKKDHFVTKTKKCFVIMPFKQLFNDNYENIIKPIIRHVKMEPLRGDEIYRTGPVMSDIWDSISSAELVIAELTGRNPNVLIEVGLALAIKKPLVIISQMKKDIPFDLQALRYIIYNSEDNLKEQLSKTLHEISKNPLMSAKRLAGVGFDISKLKTGLFETNPVFNERFNQILTYYYAGAVCMETADYQEAIMRFEQAMNCSKNDDDITYQIACCYAMLRREDEMLECLKEAIKMNKQKIIHKIHKDQDKYFLAYKNKKKFIELVNE